MSMDDERFDDALDERLLAAAREYHVPPSTPSEAMWARIDAERRARQARRSTREHARVWWIAIGAIAAALLVGVVLGRWSMMAGGRAPMGTPPGAIAVAPSVVPVAPSTGEPPSVPSVAPAPGEHAPAGAGREPREGSALANAGPEHHPVHGARGGATSGSTTAPYQLAAVAHLGQAEALLTTVRADARAGRVDTSVTAWARDLLSTTRLMMDSPAARDPQLRRLLQDLELVLAQITTLRQGDTTDLDYIDRTLDRRSVLLRLRQATPPVALRAGT